MTGHESSCGPLRAAVVESQTPMQMVREFSAATGGDDRPRQEWAALRKKLLREELAEVEEALDGGSLAEIARELADLVYVAYGSAVRPGLDLDAAVREVHRANMSKISLDGVVSFRQDGKVLPGPTFIPPDMSCALPPAVARVVGIRMDGLGQGSL